MPAPADTSPEGGAAPAPAGPALTSPAQERRTLLIAGAVFFGGLIVLIGLVAVLSGDAGDARPSATTQACAPGDAPCEAAQQSVERPGIIPRPGEGQAPDEPGDRGGWEQIALLGVLVAGLGLIVTLVVRNARRARIRTRADPPT